MYYVFNNEQKSKPSWKIKFLVKTKIYVGCILLSICLCREENSLVDQFVFEVLVIFVESLALAHSDERSMGNCSSISAS